MGYNRNSGLDEPDTILLALIVLAGPVILGVVWAVCWAMRGAS